MANKQTTSLRKQGLSLRFNKGVNFTGDRAGNGSNKNPEFTLIERPSTKGSACQTAFGEARSRRKFAHRYSPTLRMSDQAKMFYAYGRP